MQKTSTKKIAFFLTSLVSGGEERTASILAKELSKKEDLTFVFFNRPIDFDIPEKVKVKILRPDYQWRLLRLLTLPLVIWRYYRYCEQAGITHSIAFDSLPNFSNCLLKLFGWKGKVYLRESNHVSTRYPKETIRGRIFHWLIRRLYPLADCIFVNADRIGKDLQVNYNIQIPIHLSLNPIDLPMIDELKLGDLSTEGKFTFIHVGMFRAQKNHALLLEAFARLQDLDCQLWLIGRGALETSIKEQVKKLDLAERVRFYGFQKNPYVYMAAVDCMILSSNYEGLPNVLSEALACGLPIISTDCPSGPREILAPETDSNNKTKKAIEFAKYGILTPVGNVAKLAEAMQYMYENNRYRKSDFFKERVKPFSVEKVVDKLLMDMEIVD